MDYKKLYEAKYGGKKFIEFQESEINGGNNELPYCK